MALPTYRDGKKKESGALFGEKTPDWFRTGAWARAAAEAAGDVGGEILDFTKMVGVSNRTQWEKGGGKLDPKKKDKNLSEVGRQGGKPSRPPQLQESAGREKNNRRDPFFHGKKGATEAESRSKPSAHPELRRRLHSAPRYVPRTSGGGVLVPKTTKGGDGHTK